MNKNNQNIDEIFQELLAGSSSNIDLAKVSGKFFNALLNKERDVFLKNQNDNKGNGHYSRKLSSSLGQLDIEVPRDRKGQLRSFFLPEKWQQFDASYQDMLTKLILNGYSPNKIKRLLDDMNLPYSPDQVQELKEELLEEARVIFESPIPEKVFALFIDVYRCGIKHPKTNRVQQASVYVAIGLDINGNTDIYAFWTLFGNENKEDWMTNLTSLISRGLKYPMLIISDDFSGITNAISTLFPKTNHQLCHVHLLRNARKNLSKQDYSDFKEMLKKTRCYSNNEILEATTEFKSFFDDKNYPNFTKHHFKRVDQYFNFLLYPKSVKSLIYTTNKVESFNSILERLRVNSGNYFQSQNTLLISAYVTISNLKKSKWKNPNKKVLSVLYELNQLFYKQFNSDTLLE